MKGFIGQLSDRLLSVVVPKTEARAGYCLACSPHAGAEPCYVTWQTDLDCLTRTNGWQNIGCYSYCP